MILKSVSGPIRILALAAVLLIPAWGRAEITTTWTVNSETDRTHTIVVTPGNNDLHLACDGHICATGATQENAMAITACYQRMREAMRAMNEVKNHAKLDYYGIQLSLTHIWIAERWRPVLQDCVEGGK